MIMWNDDDGMSMGEYEEAVGQEHEPEEEEKFSPVSWPYAAGELRMRHEEDAIRGEGQPVDRKDENNKIDIDLTKFVTPPFHRHKLTHDELSLLKKGIELLPKDITKHFQEAYLSLVSKFENTDYFVVMYVSGVKSKRKKRAKNTKQSMVQIPR